MSGVNFHIHTNLSDGKYSPEEIIHLANEEQLQVIALTDHNCMLPKRHFERLRSAFNGILIRGCEVSVQYISPLSMKEYEIHVVCLFMDDSTCTSKFEELVRRNLAYDRREYINQILDCLKQEGINIGSYDELLLYYPMHVGRLQIAQRMEDMGFVADAETALDEYIGSAGKRKCYVPNPHKAQFCKMEELIIAAKEAKALPILAHIKSYGLSEEEERQLLKEFRWMTGKLGAMETQYYNYSSNVREYLSSLAKIYDLAESAATDYHGILKTDVLNAGFSYEYYERLMQVYQSYYSEQSR